MPEGPTIFVLREEILQFKGKKTLNVEGSSKENIQQAKGKKLVDIRTLGKNLFLCFDGFSIKIHLLLFGSYRVDERKTSQPRLSLQFKNGEMNFYGCSVKVIEGDIDEIYDWSIDIMSDEWNEKAARKKLRYKSKLLVCDALLDQNIFAGSGNIIKNEVLFRTKVHPKSLVDKLPARKLNELSREVRIYSFQFLEWKKAFVLKKHWLAYTKRKCPRCKIPIIKEYLGKTNRRTFFCNSCQKLYK